jgi:hypothetical protein
LDKGKEEERRERESIKGTKRGKNKRRIVRR